ncbi:MAG: mechanosensitive ion channel [Gammaproteobacteria bacterium]|nr:mechanosensitive ion channel [Gammaproteobacteria bacterium]
MDLLTQYFDNVQWQDLIFSGLRILLILIMVWVVSGIIRKLLQRLEQALTTRGHAEGEVPGEAAKRAETLVRLLRQGIVILLWVMAILLILRQLGVDIAPILASAGVVGLAVGFGAQNLVRDVISGFFMILENQVRVGDVAIINGTGGLVERINFRTIVLRDLSGIVHTFPNGTITTLANMTREWSAFVFEIGVAYKEDTDKVVDVLKAVGRELREDPTFGSLMIGDVEIFGVDRFADSAVVIKGRTKTLPIKQWDVGREYQRRVKKAFDAAGIEIPFPHVSVYFGQDSRPFLAGIVEQPPAKS